MKDAEHSDLSLRKYRILSLIKECIRGFYLILLVSAICLLVLVAIMLLI